MKEKILAVLNNGDFWIVTNGVLAFANFAVGNYGTAVICAAVTAYIVYVEYYKQ